MQLVGDEGAHRKWLVNLQTKLRFKRIQIKYSLVEFVCENFRLFLNNINVNSELEIGRLRDSRIQTQTRAHFRNPTNCLQTAQNISFDECSTTQV